MAITRISGAVGPPPAMPGRTALPAAQDSEPAPRAAPPDGAQLQQATEMINRAMRSMSRGLQFSVDQSTGKTVVRVVDQDTEEVIRQIPSEEVMKIASEIDRFQGMLLRQKA